MPLHMRLATEADVDGIARVSVAAFSPSTDALARNLFPARLQPSKARAEDPALAWRRTRKGIMMHTGRAVLVVVTDDELLDQIVGFSLWMEPVPEGHVEGSGTASTSVVPCETLDQEAFKTMTKLTHEATTGYFGQDGSKHMWYLDYLGVHPDHQRRGIGRMLLNWGLEKAREQNKDVYLIATPAGFPLYQAVGFEDLGSFLMFETPHNGMIKRRQAH